MNKLYIVVKLKTKTYDRKHFLNLDLNFRKQNKARR